MTIGTVTNRVSICVAVATTPKMVLLPMALANCWFCETSGLEFVKILRGSCYSTCVRRNPMGLLRLSATHISGLAYWGHDQLPTLQLIHDVVDQLAYLFKITSMTTPALAAEASLLSGTTIDNHSPLRIARHMRFAGPALAIGVGEKLSFSRKASSK